MKVPINGPEPTRRLPGQLLQSTLQSWAMHNPFDQISAAFAPEYRVNLSIERLDGSIMLTLSDDAGVVAKRLITQAQRNDPLRLQRVIDSIRLGLAIELGQNPLQVLAALTREPAPGARPFAAARIAN